MMGARTRSRSLCRGLGIVTAAALGIPVAALAVGAPVPAPGRPAYADGARSGGLFAWGDNASGELGRGSVTSEEFQAAQVTALGPVSAVSAGNLHVLVALPDGTVVAWGSNPAGQLGNGGTSDSALPIPVRGLRDVGCPAGAPRACKPVAAGGAHSLALRTDGSVIAWGANSWGQLGNGTNVDSATPVAVNGLDHVVGISAGEAHSLAVKADGTVWAWGDGGYGQLGTNRLTRDPQPVPVQVMMAEPGSKTPGFVCSSPFPTSLVPVTGASAVSAGFVSSFAVGQSGTVLGWGRGSFGQLGDGTKADGVTQCTPGTPPGSPFICNGLCRLTAAPVVVQTAPAPSADYRPLTGVVELSSSRGTTGHSLALLGDGSVMAWGGNFEGQLGLGFEPDSRAYAALVPVKGPSGQPVAVAAVAAGGGHSLVAGTDGTVYAWGLNVLSELGRARTTLGPDPRHSFAIRPIPVPGVSGATSVTAGGSFSIALTGGLPSAAPHATVSVPQTAMRPPTVARPSDAAPPANVEESPTTPGVTATFPPVLAADAAHPGHLAVAYSDDKGSFAHGQPPGRCRLSLSSDGGSTWISRALVGPKPTAQGDEAVDFATPPSVQNPTRSFRNCGSSFTGTGYSVAFGPDGTLYYAFGPTDGLNDGRVYLTASTDGGATFSTPVQVDTNARPPDLKPNGGDQDYLGSLSVDQESGEVYVAWTEFSRIHPGFNPIRVARCVLVGTRPMCGPGIQATPDRTVDGNMHFRLAVGSEGRLYLAWTDESELFASDGNSARRQQGWVGPVSAMVVASDDHGRTFGAPTVADRALRVCPQFRCPTGTETLYPFAVAPMYNVSIAAGSHPAHGDGGDGGKAPVAVALSGARFGSGGKVRVTVTRSVDGAASWGRPQVVGILEGLEDHQQHDPGLVMGEDGTVDVAYYDRSFKGMVGITPEGTQDVYLATSRDGGRFSPPRKLDDVTSEVKVLGKSNFTSPDDLAPVSLVATDHGLLAGWLDGRLGTLADGRTDGFFARVGENEDQRDHPDGADHTDGG